MGNKIIFLIVIVAVAAVVVGGYVYWLQKRTSQVSSPSTPLESAIQGGDTIASSAVQGVLPSIGKATNPLENKPVVNPVDVSNPFKSVKTNPFQY